MTAAFVPRGRRSGSERRVLWILLLLVGLLGCKGDGLSDYQREQNKKEERVNTLNAQGATVKVKRYGRYGNGYVVNLSGAQITDSTFENLKALKRVAELDLSKSSITDDQMNQLNEVGTWLVELDLSNTAVTDAGLEKLTNLRVLFNLNLAGTQVTLAGVERFKKQRLATAQVKETVVKLK